MLSVTAGTVRDWSIPAKGGMDHLVAMWVAFAYANGHLFIVPNNVWCFSEEKGEHSYQGPEDVFLPLYQFVRRNARLLDGYDPIEQIGIVYSTAVTPSQASTTDNSRSSTRRKPVDTFSETCQALVDAHYPFGVIFPNRSGGKQGFSAQQLQRFERVVLPKDVVLPGKDRPVFDAWRRAGRAVTWSGVRSALGDVDPLFRVDGNSRIWVLPRTNSDDPAAPVVCHLFNPCYDAQRDAMIEQTDIVLSVRPGLLGGQLRKAVLHTPAKPPQEISVRHANGRIELKIPRLTLWGILILEHDSAHPAP